MQILLKSTIPDDAFWRAFEESFVGPMDLVLEQMGLTPEELEEVARTTGDVRSVDVDGQQAGWLWLELRGRMLHLHALLLGAAFRGRGIGGRVLSVLEEEFAGRADQFEVGVQAGNVASTRLVEKTGFCEVGGRPELGFRILRKPLSGSR